VTFTSINPNTAVISGGTISKSAFGNLVCSNFDDHETRIAANESDVRGASNALTVVRDTGGRRWHSGSSTLISNSTTPVVHPFDSIESASETGYTYSGGIFTIASTGLYDIEANLCGAVSTDTGYYIQAFIAINSSGSPGTNLRWAYSSVGIGTSGQKLISVLYAKRVAISVGQGFSVWIRADIAGTAKTYTPAAPPDGLATIAQAHPTNISIQRVG
jgi:hypothetical protein